MAEIRTWRRLTLDEHFVFDNLSALVPDVPSDGALSDSAPGDAASDNRAAGGEALRGPAKTSGGSSVVRTAVQALRAVPGKAGEVPPGAPLSPDDSGLPDP